MQARMRAACCKRPPLALTEVPPCGLCPGRMQVALRRIDFTPGEALATLLQETLRVSVEAGVYVVTAARSTAAITVADIEAQRCIMHIVDTVLVPSSIRVDV